MMGEGTGLIKRFYEDVLAKGELDLLDELATEDLVDHEEGLPGQPTGREGVKFFINAMREAFPDIEATAIEPTADTGWSSKIGFQVSPPSVDFQTPPDAVAA